MKVKKRERYRIIVSILIFIALLVIVCLLMSNRMRQMMHSYMEKQVTHHAEELSEIITMRFHMELQNMEILSECIEESEKENKDFLTGIGTYLFPERKEGMTTGLLTLDGQALHGEALAFSDFSGIRDAFRGNRSVSFCSGKGLLFTVPVYRESNVKYVFYRLYASDILAEEFFIECFEGRGDVAVVDITEQEVVPFKEHDFEKIYSDDLMYAAYKEVLSRLSVASAASVFYESSSGGQFIFSTELPGYGMFLVGTVPETVMSEGLSSFSKLVIWVFTLLAFLMVIGIAYLFNAEERAKASDELRMEKIIAENASRSKSDFLANMSHEIRTPINAIIGMNEMVLRECKDGSVKEYAVNIQSASQVLLSLVNDILDLSKIEAGKMEILNDIYRLDGLIRDVVNMMRIKAEKSKLEFEVEVEESLPSKLYGDEGRNRQIIINILNNAVKYTKEGKVVLRVCAESRDEEQILLKICVSDTGIGIRKEDMEKLFGNFERFDLDKNSKIEGTGLGLAITKRFVDAMGGRIEVDSEYGKGSVFTVYLPQKIIDAAPIGELERNSGTEIRDRSVSRDSFTAPDAHILVVDDNEMNLLVVESLLKRTKIQVRSCSSGEECLALMQKEHFHVILVDHMMPGMDGIEVMKRAKNLEGNLCQDSPMIALTANAIKGVREMYISQGFDDYLSKPIESDQLEEMLKKYLPVELVLPVSDANEIEELQSTESSGAGELIDHNVAMEYCAQDEEIYLQILQVYCEKEKDNREKLAEYKKENDWQHYIVEIHALKSTSLNIGCRKLYDAALALETAGKSGDMEFIAANHDKCMELYRETVKEGKAYLEASENQAI